ncbi:Na+-transporting NADH:ubiquinone oxidoreductase subunit A [Marinobacter daqiaonensis]|uniref:Na(+)-translocating NADH-quinone reductase subunit A n=1 Tax=Marinobacter daqiaonensis TaxID=650891 RepID=A0A1I6H5E7_9GAMM|nr:Na(+)-translocating NADH-quinone reductase subunit A [Marinobacter daqiaonensis]SFR49491.1 Na+-transporting NADH:ubiquinone oxidoreductase subunit A [Marinobacter daqiaonensis]
MINIKKGLDLPISGAPDQTISDGKPVRHVALVGFDYNGMKPTMEVKEGDRVKRGSLLFTDKKTEGVRYTSPAAGVVKEINRGERRVFQSVVIEIDGDEAESFARYSENDLASLERQQVVDNLVESGLWTAFRSRPFSKVPAIDSAPHSIFVSVMDTNPLAADPVVVIGEQAAAFEKGLTLLTRLTTGKVFVTGKPGSDVPVPKSDVVEVQQFDGVHPAGNVGTHIHYLDPVSLSKTVWTIGYQDVIAIAKLFETGELPVDRVVAIGGPKATSPRLVRTRVGASLTELLKGEIATDCKVRMISGSVFGGRRGEGTCAYLGRFANQISVLEEGDKREFMGWLSPGANKFSIMNIYLSKLVGGKRFDMTTTTNGSERAMVPVGVYEKVMPLDILPTQLLRSLIVGDTEVAQKLGALELDEEDLALCTFVCPGKYEYGPILRENLTRIELEG